MNSRMQSRPQTKGKQIKVIKGLKIEHNFYLSIEEEQCGNVAQDSLWISSKNGHVGFCSSKTICMESYLLLEEEEKRIFKSATQIRSVQSYPEVDIQTCV